MKSLSVRRLRSLYTDVRNIRPEGTRSQSSGVFLVGLGRKRSCVAAFDLGAFGIRRCSVAKLGRAAEAYIVRWSRPRPTILCAAVMNTLTHSTVTYPASISFTIVRAVSDIARRARSIEHALQLAMVPDRLPRRLPRQLAQQVFIRGRDRKRPHASCLEACAASLATRLVAAAPPSRSPAEL